LEQLAPHSQKLGIERIEAPPNINLGHGPSFLRWAGSKRKKIAELEEHAMHATNYIEPFLGSAAQFFYLKPRVALLSDTNSDLISTYKLVRDNPRGIYDLFSALRRNSETYYAVRDAFNFSCLSAEERAAYFVFLNRNCFNGLWRTNSSGQFNVPFGDNRMAANPPKQLFIDCALALNSARLLECDFRDVLSDIDETFSIYADPPYLSETSRVFKEYGSRVFSFADFRDLVELLDCADKRGARITLSYSGDETRIALPNHWKKRSLNVVRNLGGFVKAGSKQIECVYTNYRLQLEAAL
jgi:DNA adenine methylase